MDSTHDLQLRSFVPPDPSGDFPIQNLPYGVFRPRAGGPARCGIAIGEWVLDLAVLERHGLLEGVSPAGESVFDRGSLNAFLALGRAAWPRARETVSR